MLRIVFAAVVGSLFIMVPQSWAQGAFNMGQLTGSLSQDHITQSERARARGQRTRRGYNNRTAQACANVPIVRRRLGASDPRVRRLVQLCHDIGY